MEIRLGVERGEVDLQRFSSPAMDVESEEVRGVWGCAKTCVAMGRQRISM